MSRELFRAANTFVGHRRGGLGIATIAACGGFAAISGSSVATAATFSTVAYPEMRRYGYPKSFAAGVIAAGGTLGVMLPPSTVLAVYGLITEQDIGKLFIAGILPGLLAATMYILSISVIALVRPGFLPAGPPSSWKERMESVGDQALYMRHHPRGPVGLRASRNSFSTSRRFHLVALSRTFLFERVQT